MKVRIPIAQPKSEENYELGGWVQLLQILVRFALLQQWMASPLDGPLIALILRLVPEAKMFLLK
jgi:hypothetical protein